MTKIFIDPGHGGSDPGATGNGLQEKHLTLAIALKIRDILNSEYEGHTVMLSRTTDQDVSLTQRTNMANNWGADYLVSVHINAGGGTGFESYTYNGSYSGKAETNRLRGIVHDAVVDQTGYRDRGKKEANFHMLRESAMPAVLTENGFIDNSSDAANLKSNAFLTRIARGHVAGLANAFGLIPKSSGGDSGTKKYVEIIVDSLWTYNTADWDDKAVVVNRGEVFTVIRDRFPVGGGYMYQIKSGLYITANPSYVRYYTR
ncbi:MULTISPECIES: N-acetylmuramoyl-L-alanine amidase [Sediminibacillus]|uniref:N-acetylmuramoyl-L-alanine amidase n=1 Tax=Sediminibacillus TaxID=482460 RepID=UPI00040B9F62|nr:N-acetylmuramoyl-L-alanine amidase [Sediminibacillus terrae]